NYWWLMVVIALAAGLMISNLLVQAQENESKAKWEYKLITVNRTSNVAETLNKHASDGWELVDWEATSFILRREIK
ncbi:MAG: DUF4177 domain-containing protein, partial [Candidatus Aureabacteria bacterium]|nr:DUF4177 domain-containing protein [Candidatus Auribacterota bacterium]